MTTQEIIVGDCREMLRTLSANSVQVCCTSPPYWGLRSYFGCPCVVDKVADPDCTKCHGTGNLPGAEHELGSEPTPEEFIATMVDVFREVRRVLREDGTCWVNMGDGYWNGGGTKTDGGHGFVDGGKVKLEAAKGAQLSPKCSAPGLKPKDLIGMPWRLALALQADGWWLRSAIPWVKHSAMPESATDRPGTALEYMFLLTKKARYFWDGEAVRQKAAPATHARDKYSRILENDGPQSVRHDHETQVSEAGRNWRNADLWFESIKSPHGLVGVGDELVGLDVNPQGYSEAHYATFPERLVSPCLKAGTSLKGCCPECGKAWGRVVERTSTGKP